MKCLNSLLLLASAVAARGGEALSQRDVTITGAAPDRVRFLAENRGTESGKVEIAAGTIVAGAEGTSRLVVIQSALLEIPAGSVGEMLLPAVLLSAKAPFPEKTLRILPDTEVRLEPLLKRLAPEKDLPRATAQLAVLCVLEDLTFAGWQKFLTAQRAADQESHPTPAEVAQAVDVIGLLCEIAPQGKFALAADGELKFRALRNPWCRVKAMRLFGIKASDDAGEFGLPNLGQLLHTKADDNCPVCRARTEMQKGAGDF